MSVVAEGILWLYDIGFFTSLLPFVLIYTIVYAIMRKTGILGQPNYDALFAFCLAFFTIFRIDIVEQLPIFFARVAILFLILVSVMLLSGMVGIHESYSNKFIIGLLGLYLVYIVVDTFMGTEVVMGFLEQIPLNVILGVVIVLGIFMAVVSFISGGDSSSGSSKKVDTQPSKPARTSKPAKQTPAKNKSVPEQQQAAPSRQERSHLPVRKDVTSDDYETNEVETKTLDDIRREFG